MSATQVEEKNNEPVEVTNKYDGTQLKNAVDDELARFYSKKLGFEQSHTHTDVKLITGYVSCFIAAGAFWNEYKSSFTEALSVTIVCVVIYWIIQLIAVAYSYLVEKNEIFVGTQKVNGKPTASLVISGKSEKYSPYYTLDFKYHDKTINKTVHYNIKPNITTWFNTKGVLVKEVMNKDLSSYLSTIKQTLHKE